jgi:hypothetical protein
MAGLGNAAAPLPLLGASAPPVRVGLPLDNRAQSAGQKPPASWDCRRTWPITANGVIRSLSLPRVTSRVHKECRSTYAQATWIHGAIPSTKANRSLNSTRSHG